MKCPDCGAECVRDGVDIGVGVQYSPWRCDNCGWDQESASRKAHPEDWALLDKRATDLREEDRSYGTDHR